MEYLVGDISTNRVIKAHEYRVAFVLLLYRVLSKILEKNWK